MKIGISKTSSTLLLLSLPLNIIVISGIGNVYLSTVMVMLQFMIMLFLSNGKLVKGRITYIVTEVFLLTLVVTIINIILNGELINTQITKTVIYLQNTLAIIMMSFFVKDLRPDHFYKTFLLIVIMCVIRVYVEEPTHFFKLSVLWEERIESEFVAGVNTFAMLNGLAFVISFFI